MDVPTKFTLKQARQYVGMSQRQMAELLSISRDTYIRLEKIQDNVTIGQAKIIAGATGFSPNAIFFGESEVRK